MVLVNAAAAAACVVCALAYFFEDFAAGEFALASRGPIPFSARVFLWSMVIAVAALGIVLGASSRPFPWLAAFLLPLLSGPIMILPGDRDGLLVGLGLGCATSAVFLLGVCSARGFKRWVNVRKPLSHP